MSGFTAEEVIKFCQEQYKEFKFDVLIIDDVYNLATKNSLDSNYNRQDQQSNVMNQLRSLAKKLDCVVMSSIQIARDSKTKGTIATQHNSDYVFSLSCNRLEEENGQNKRSRKEFVEDLRTARKNGFSTISMTQLPTDYFYPDAQDGKAVTSCVAISVFCKSVED